MTLEDHVLAGGFGSAVLETVNELRLPVEVVRVGWPDEFIEHGKVEQLRQKYGLTAEAALERLRPYLKATSQRVSTSASQHVSESASGLNVAGTEV